ncbi:hypothetical protein HRJ34_21135 [Rhizorhabdus wittichii]|uniref:Uncharacterized protein n=1 Tax=Rhizorhabdus wittichii TaxID=160791 RepID=A0A975HD03_9SPHN|nr:hypothetical protein [Rhizorhabdus wittichii]QTH20802.1 hypothetical protein HRJ34_21135 [Rhizorhabdus wittichii]
MPTFLVRLNAQQKHPRDFVGVFVADNVRDLREYVDECCPTDACEFATLPNGGVFLSGTSLPIPYDLGESEEGDFFKSAQVTDSWFRYFVGPDDQAEWEPLEADEDDLTA